MAEPSLLLPCGAIFSLLTIPFAAAFRLFSVTWGLTVGDSKLSRASESCFAKKEDESGTILNALHSGIGVMWKNTSIILQWLPWKAILDEMKKILKMYLDTDRNAFFIMSYMHKVLEPPAMEFYTNFLIEETEFAKHVGKDNSSKERISGRLDWRSVKWESNIALNVAVSLLDLYCRLGSECSTLSRPLFEHEVLRRCDATAKASECVGIHSSFRGFAYCQGIKELGDVAFQKVSKLLIIEDDAEERRRLCTGLGCTQNTNLLKRYNPDHVKKEYKALKFWHQLDYVASYKCRQTAILIFWEKTKLKLLEVLNNKSAYDDREVADVFQSVENNPLSNEWLLRFCISEWKAIQNRLAKDYNLLSAVLRSCLSKVKSRKEMLMIASAHKSCCDRNHDALQEALELAEFRMKWIEKYSKIVSELARAELERLEKDKPVTKNNYLEIETI